MIDRITEQPFCQTRNRYTYQTRVSGSTDIKTKPIWTDYHLNGFKWYRKWRKCKWYKHQFTNDALQLSITFTGTWWALYGKINRYSDVIETEEW